jgi:glycosyltransferase involved in cell wall biosynthesis
VNIAIFTDTYIPQVNGVVTSILSFQHELERLGHRVYIFCPSYGGRETKLDRVYRYYSIPYQTEAMREQRIAFPFSRSLFLFHRFKIDIIHFHVPHIMGAYGLFLAWIWKIPAVHTYHTLFIKYTHYVSLRESLTERAVKFISRQFCNRCVRIVAPSPELKHEISRYGIIPPIDVIPTGINFEPGRTVRDRESLFRRYRLPREKKRLVFVGRFAKEKNIDLLLEILKELNMTSVGYHLLLIGDGPDRPHIESRIRLLKMEDTVTITGYIPRTGVFDLLQISDLLVFPSETETQGLVLLEAMAVGTPVVASDAMGAGDVLRDRRGGIAVRTEKKEFLCAILSLLGDPDLYEEKRRSGLEKAREWSEEVMTRRLLDFYGTAIRDYTRKRFGPSTDFD